MMGKGGAARIDGCKAVSMSTGNCVVSCNERLDLGERVEIRPQN